MTDSAKDAAADGDKSSAVPMFIVASEFSATLDGLRELVETLTPHAAALDGEFESKAAALAPVDRDEQLRIERYLAEVVGETEERIGSSDAESADRGESAPTAKRSSEKQGDSNVIEEVFSGRKDLLGEWLLRLTGHFVGGPRTLLLNRSLLTVAVAAFEALVAALATEHLRRFPNALGESEKEFSLADLRAFADLEDAREALIARRVDALMRESASTWSEWAKKLLGLSFEQVAVDYDAFLEVFQRRHLVVHTGGRVSQQYVAKVAPRYQGAKVGEVLRVSGEYLENALDELEAVGTSLAFAAWSAWCKEERDAAASKFSDRAFELLQARRYRLVRELCLASQAFVHSDALKQVLRVNGWIAEARLNGLEAIAESVAAWDTSALASRFRLAQEVLLGHHEAAFARLAVLVDAGEVELESLEGWPLLDALREDDRFASLLEVATSRDQATVDRPLTEEARVDTIDGIVDDTAAKPTSTGPDEPTDFTGGSL